MGIQFRLRQSRKRHASTPLVIATGVVLVVAMLSVGGLAVWTKLHPTMAVAEPMAFTTPNARAPYIAPTAWPSFSAVPVRASATTAVIAPSQTPVPSPAKTMTPATVTEAPQLAQAAPADIFESTSEGAQSTPSPAGAGPTALPAQPAPQPASSPDGIPNTGFGVISVAGLVAAFGGALAVARKARKKG